MRRACVGGVAAARGRTSTSTSTSTGTGPGPGRRVGQGRGTAGAEQGADLHCSTFAQAVAFEVARGGFLDRHVQQIRDVYRERRDAMLTALERWFPPGVSWTRPMGGLFLWLTLPEGFDSTELLKHALEREKVAFVPGASFFPRGGGERTCRLNFSYAAPDVIDEGIRRLGSVIERRLATA